MPLPLVGLGAATIAFLVNAARIMLIANVGALIVKALTFFGLAFVAHKFAIQPMLDQLESYAQSGAGSGSLATAVMQWSGVMKLDIALTMVLSAFAVAATIKSAKVALGIAGN